MTPTFDEAIGAYELATFIRDQLPRHGDGYVRFEDGYSLDHGIIDGKYNLVALAKAILTIMSIDPLGIERLRADLVGARADNERLRQENARLRLANEDDR